MTEKPNSVCKHCQKLIFADPAWYHPETGSQFCDAMRGREFEKRTDLRMAEPVAEPAEPSASPEPEYEDFMQKQTAEDRGESPSTCTVSAKPTAEPIHVHSKICYQCGHDDCPCLGGYLHENPMCNRVADPQPVAGEGAWRKLPVGHWFFLDSPVCTNRYSVQERTDSGCTLVCSTPWHHDGAKIDMQKIADLHNSQLAEGTPKLEEIAWKVANELFGQEIGQFMLEHYSKQIAEVIRPFITPACHEFDCPVCYWPHLGSDPTLLNYDICPRCGVEFGNEMPEDYPQIRAKWEAAGRPFWSKTVEAQREMWKSIHCIDEATPASTGEAELKGTNEPTR